MQSIDTNQNPHRRTENLSIEMVNGETLLYDETCHQAHCLNSVASAIWSACDGSSSIAEISRVASLALGAPVTEDAVLLALEDFRRDNLLQSCPAVEVSPALHSRRAMAIKLGTAAALLLPIVATIVAPKAAQAYNGCADC